MNLCNDSPDSVEVGLASYVYSVIGNRGVGQTVVMPADYSVKQTECSKYVVANRIVMKDEVLIRLESCCGEPAASCACMAKQILLRFDGGHLHGRSLDGHSSNIVEALRAVAYYLITEHGKVGEAFDGIPAPLLPQGPVTDSEETGGRKDWEYQITERIEDENRILVRFQYRAKDERKRA